MLEPLYFNLDDPVLRRRLSITGIREMIFFKLLLVACIFQKKKHTFAMRLVIAKVHHELLRSS